MKPLASHVAILVVAFGVSGWSVAAMAAHMHDQQDGADAGSSASEGVSENGDATAGGASDGQAAGMHHGQSGHMSKGHGDGRRGHHRHHRRMRHEAPDVVINIYPGGGMDMMRGDMMSRHMAMMKQGGMMSGGNKGHMGGMMSDGMGMMGQGGMMMGEGEASAEAQPVTVDQVRERMAAMMERMGGGMAIGEVKELDEDLIDAELTDPSGAPAGRMIINRHSGAMMRLR